MEKLPSIILCVVFVVFRMVTSDADVSENPVYPPVLYKCQCGADEVLQNGTCETHPSRIPVWDTVKQEEVAVNTNEFGNVVIKTVNCGHNMSLVYLDIHDSWILTNGSLFSSALPGNVENNYCIEHILSEAGKMTIDVRVCQPVPQISTCCPDSHFLGDNGLCINSDSSSFTYSKYISVGTIWENYTTVNVNLSCVYGEIPVDIMVGASEEDTQGNAVFVWQVFLKLIGDPLGVDVLIEDKQLRWDQYCLVVKDAPDGTQLSARVCSTDPALEHRERCGNFTCIRKCCPFGFALNNTAKLCIPYEKNFTHELDFYNEARQLVPRPVDLTIVEGIPLCPDPFLLDRDAIATKRQILLQDGNFHVEEGLAYTSMQYCLDTFVEDGDEYTSGFACFADPLPSCQWKWVFGSVLLGISCIFYAATLLIYLTVPHLRSSLAGKCVISQLISFLVTYVMLIILQNNVNFSMASCSIPGTLEHVAVLASFFWLNVMCFDMWTTFRSQFSAPANKGRRFLFYSLYAWGLPLLMAVVRIIADELPLTQYPWAVKSMLGKTHCFFSSKHPGAKWLYLYGPILVLLLVNITLFLHVAVVIYRNQQENQRMLRTAESNLTGKKLHSKKNRAKLYLKLFLVMGICWILEIILWIAVPEENCYAWVRGIDVINMLQGVCIFWIYVCKKSTLHKIKVTYRNCCPVMPMDSAFAYRMQRR